MPEFPISLPSGRVVLGVPRYRIEHAGQRFVDRLPMEQVARPTPIAKAAALVVGNPLAPEIRLSALYVRRPLKWVE
jgi:hypothetical protein